ncbi:MAG: hypothetical protein KIG31_03625 [Oscillospiraceae bacterium]|nr:hypothetical protein [Oscillospiraceae bacterium]MCI6972853.1 hypothetical protein [Clostridiales bacterium]
MYNRYRGNGSRPERMEDHPSAKSPTPCRPPFPPPSAKPPKRSGLIPEKLTKSLASLETEDLLLILILYLMYRESGDKELLIIMGAMYLL